MPPLQIIETYGWKGSLLSETVKSNLKDESMKRLVTLVALVLLAGVAGIVVRSASRDSGAVAELKGLVSHNASDQVREDIRRSYELAPGAHVELSGLNGSVNIETSDSKTAEVFIERLGDSPEALGRRKITVDADANGLRIKGEKGDGSFFGRLFGSSPHVGWTNAAPFKFRERIFERRFIEAVLSNHVIKLAECRQTNSSQGSTKMHYVLLKAISCTGVTPRAPNSWNTSRLLTQFSKKLLQKTVSAITCQ